MIRPYHKSCRIIGVILLPALFLLSCLKNDMPDYQKLLNEEIEKLGQFMEHHYPGVEPDATGLYYIEYTEGTGDSAKYNSKVKVNYTGYRISGLDMIMFDSSMDTAAIRGGIYVVSRTYQPYEFYLGDYRVITGFQEGAALIREGGSARVVFPSNLGYGSRGTTGIPPYTSLVFDIYSISVDP